MCGIAGIFSHARSAKPVDGAALARIRDAMVRRGPDGEGLWISPDRRVGLAHRRLSIIDLTSGGAQPMATADGRLRITFNGEIYNYQELRRHLESRGYVFRSNSDTEVLLHLYADRGKEMVHALRGMYAFGLWDDSRQVLFLARDPFGIKPLYVANDGATVRFASQVKALLCGGGIDEAPDPAGSVGLLIWGYVPEPFTLYRGISSLPAGSTMEIQASGQVTVDRFFDVHEVLLAVQDSPPPPRNDQAAFLREVVSDSVRHHLVADVPVGLFLSAGIDSSSVAGLAAEHAQKLRAITLGFPEFRGTAADEVPLAERVAQHFGIRHEAHWIQREEFETELERIFEAMDQPSADGVNTFFVSRAAARSGMKVALSGLGGDELFGGYPSFRQVPELVRWLRVPAAVPGVGTVVRKVMAPLTRLLGAPKYAGLLEYGGNYAGAYLLRRAHFMPWELRDLLDPATMQAGLERLCILRRLDDTVAGLREPRSRIAALEHSWYMRNQLLRDSDWAGMAHSLEIRLPLVDVQVFRALAPLIAWGRAPTKLDLAATVRPALPAAVLNREKSGFVTPIGQWISRTAGGEGAFKAGQREWAKRVLPPQPPMFRVWMPLTDAFGGTGGIAKFNRDLISALASLPGCARVVCTPRVIGSELQPLPPGVEFTTAAARGTAHFLWHVIRELVAGRFDLLIIGHINLAPIALLNRALRRTPSMLVIHGIDAWKPHRSALVRASLGSVATVVGVSNLTLSRFSEWSGTDTARLRLLPNCVDLARYLPGPPSPDLKRTLGLQDRTVIMTLGRLASEDRYKGFDEILEVLPELARQIPNISYLICGDGSDRQRLESKASELKVRDRVVFAGFVAEEQKGEFYRLSDAFVMPSRGEGFGIVFLEALACGIPVLGSRVDGSREALLQGKLGALADPSDLEEVRMGVLETLRRGTGNVPAALDHYSYEAFVERVEAIIAGAMREPRIAVPAARN